MFNFTLTLTLPPPPKDSLGGQKFSWGGHLPPPRHPNDVPGKGLPNVEKTAYGSYRFILKRKKKLNKRANIIFSNSLLTHSFI